MKKFSTLLFLLLSYFCFAQNLVPNPSFEIYDTCPNWISQINRATGWSSYSITPDYFNSCASDTGIVTVSVPSNYCGFQYARTGNAYAGFIAYQSSAVNQREYVGIKLNQPLVIGQKYFASFWISRAVSKHTNANIAINKIGLRLSTVAYSESNPEPTDNNAQVYTDSIITDTLNWTEISGSFIADSAYHYLGIGNFFNDSSTSYIRFDSATTLAYYFLDDVYLSTDSINGISTYNNDFINVFPNPARDWIVIEGRNISKISLFDVLGKLCLSKEVSFSSLEKIDVSDLDRGLYFLYVQTSTENFIKKITLQ